VANDIEVSVGFEDVQTLRRELVGISKDAKSSASVFEREYNKVERTLKATAKASQSYYSSLLNLEKASKSASASASVFEKALNRDAVATKNLAIEKDRLAKAYVPLYAQSKLYEAELEKLNRAQALGVISDKQRQASLEQLNTSFAKGTGVFSKYSQEISRRTSSMGVVMQQTGYQVGDFLVQVQSGTNPMVAFGQQATQLVGVLPLMTGLFGLSTTALIGLSAGLGIAIPLVTAIAAYFLRSGDAAKKASGSLDSYAEAMKGLAEETANAQSKVDQFYLKTTSSAVAKAKREIEDLKVQAAQAKKEAEDAAKLLASSTSGEQAFGLAFYAGSLEADKKVAQDKLDAINKELAARYQILRVQEGISAAEDAAATQNMIKLGRLTRLRELALVPLQNAIALEKQQGDKVEELYGKVVRVGSELLNISRVQLVDVFTSADTGANKLLGTLSKMLAKMNSMAQFGQNYANMGGGRYVNKNELFANMGGRGGTTGANGAVAGVVDSKNYSLPDNWKNKPTKTPTGVVAGKIDTQEEYLAKLVREYDMKKKSLGMTDQQIKRNEFIFTLDEKIATMKTKTSEQDIQTERTKAIASYDSWQAAEKQAAVMTSVTSSLETMFMSFVDGTKSVGDAFKGMLRDIILQIYRQQVAETAARGIGSFISGLLKSANGNVFSGGSHVNAYADGGVVGGPTYFPMSGGKTGLMGEAGPEAIMPLKRGANGKLGVQVDGSSGGNITVVQHNSFGAGVSRAEIQAMMPKIVETTKAAVLDAKKRGGSYGSAFA